MCVFALNVHSSSTFHEVRFVFYRALFSEAIDMSTRNVMQSLQFVETCISSLLIDQPPAKTANFILFGQIYFQFQSGTKLVVVMVFGLL